MDPGADRGELALQRVAAGVELELGAVIVVGRPHAADDRQVIHLGGQAGQVRVGSVEEIQDWLLACEYVDDRELFTAVRDYVASISPELALVSCEAEPASRRPDRWIRTSSPRPRGASCRRCGTRTRSS